MNIVKLKKLIYLVPVVSLFFVVYAESTSAASPDMKGTVQVMEKGAVKIHTYLSPVLQATHIIESQNSLVLVDAQFMVPFAREFRAYTDSLGKPIERIIITHGHPDHFFGLGAAFEDKNENIYALVGTQQFIKKVGPKMLKNIGKKLGKAAPEKIIVPAHVLEPGMTTIDGVKYEFERLVDGEAAEQLLIKLPELHVLIVQDLAFNNLHLFMGNNTFSEWINILESLQNLVGYDTVLVGHGKPADTTVLAFNIEYLREAEKALAMVDNAEAFKAQLIEKYPNLGGKRMIDISTPRLFKGK